MHTLSDEPDGLIYNIQKYTIHDGPGIRTEIFMKGCPMRCLWCSNPESQDFREEIAVYPQKCIGADKCGECLEACPAEKHSPIVFIDGHVSAVNMIGECFSCMNCVDRCPSRAINVWGKKMSVSECMEIIEEDRSFYEKSGGGVTLNGGEVISQWKFAAALLKACRDEGIHTCVETALECSWPQAKAVFEYTDLIITDIKHMDSAKHKLYTGVGNETILKNIKHAGGLNIPIVVRTPIVLGYNADEGNIRATGEFIKDELIARGAEVVQYQLLPYRKMGTEKYASLGMTYPMGSYLPPERDEWEPNLLMLTEMLREDYGIPAASGSSQKLFENI